MASYTITAGQLAAHDKTLVANTVDTVTFTDVALQVEVLTDGSATIYFTVDGTTPTISGSNCQKVPTYPSGLIVRVPIPAAAVVKLISAGTPTYSVTNAS